MKMTCRSLHARIRYHGRARLSPQPSGGSGPPAYFMIAKGVVQSSSYPLKGHGHLFVMSTAFMLRTHRRPLAYLNPGGRSSTESKHLVRVLAQYGAQHHASTSESPNLRWRFKPLPPATAWQSDPSLRHEARRNKKRDHSWTFDMYYAFNKYTVYIVHIYRYTMDTLYIGSLACCRCC